MNLKIIVSLLLLITSLNFTFAQKEYHEVIDKFLEEYKKDPIKGIDYVFSTNKWMSRNQDGLDNLKNQLKNSLELIGEFNEFEKITEKSVGQSLKLISYLAKYDRQPLRFTIILYKPKDLWQVQNFKFDDTIGSELEESAKIYFLNDNWKY